MSKVSNLSFERHVAAPATAREIEDSLHVTDEDREVVRRILERMPIPADGEPDTAAPRRRALRKSRDLTAEGKRPRKPKAVKRERKVARAGRTR